MKIDPNRIEFKKVAKFLHSYKGTGRFAASSGSVDEQTYRAGKRRNNEFEGEDETYENKKVRTEQRQPDKKANLPDDKVAADWLMQAIAAHAKKSLNKENGPAINALGQLALKVVKMVKNIPILCITGTIFYAAIFGITLVLAGPDAAFTYLVPSPKSATLPVVTTWKAQSWALDYVKQLGVEWYNLDASWFNKVAIGLGSGGAVASYFGAAGPYWRAVGWVVQAVVKFLIVVGSNLAKRLRDAIASLATSSGGPPPPPPPAGAPGAAPVPPPAQQAMQPANAMSQQQLPPPSSGTPPGNQFQQRPAGPGRPTSRYNMRNRPRGGPATGGPGARYNVRSASDLPFNDLKGRITTDSPIALDRDAIDIRSAAQQIVKPTLAQKATQALANAATKAGIKKMFAIGTAAMATNPLKQQTGNDTASQKAGNPEAKVVPNQSSIITGKENGPVQIQKTTAEVQEEFLTSEMQKTEKIFWETIGDYNITMNRDTYQITDQAAHTWSINAMDVYLKNASILSNILTEVHNAQSLLNEAQVGWPAGGKFTISQDLFDAMRLPEVFRHVLQNSIHNVTEFKANLQQLEGSYQQSMISYANQTLGAILVGRQNKYSTAELTKITNMIQAQGMCYAAGFKENSDCCSGCNNLINPAADSRAILTQCGHTLGGTCGCSTGTICGCGERIAPENCIRLMPAADKRPNPNADPRLNATAKLLYDVITKAAEGNVNEADRFALLERIDKAVTTRELLITPIEEYLVELVGTLDPPSIREIQYQYDMRANKAAWIDFTLRRCGCEIPTKNFISMVSKYPATAELGTALKGIPLLSTTVILDRNLFSETPVCYGIKFELWQKNLVNYQQHMQIPIFLEKDSSVTAAGENRRFTTALYDKWSQKNLGTNVAPSLQIALENYNKTRIAPLSDETADMLEANVTKNNIFTDVSLFNNLAEVDDENALKEGTNTEYETATENMGWDEDYLSDAGKTVMSVDSVDSDKTLAQVNHLAANKTAITNVNALNANSSLDAGMTTILTNSSVLNPQVDAHSSINLLGTTASMANADLTTNALAAPTSSAVAFLKFLRAMQQWNEGTEDIEKKLAQDLSIGKLITPDWKDIEQYNRLLQSKISAEALENYMNEVIQTKYETEGERLLLNYVSLQNVYMDEYSELHTLTEYMYKQNVLKQDLGKINQAIPSYKAPELPTSSIKSTSGYKSPVLWNYVNSNTAVTLASALAKLHTLPQHKFEGSGIGSNNIPSHAKRHYITQVKNSMRASSNIRQIVQHLARQGQHYVKATSALPANTLQQFRDNKDRQQQTLNLITENMGSLVQNMQLAYKTNDTIRNYKSFHSTMIGGLRMFDDGADGEETPGEQLATRQKTVKCVHCKSDKQLYMHPKSNDTTICKGCLGKGKNMTRKREILHVGGMISIENTLHESHAKTKDMYMRENHNTQQNKENDANVKSTVSKKSSPQKEELRDLFFFMKSCPKKYRTNPLRFNTHLYAVKKWTPGKFNDLLVMLGTYFVIDRYEGGIEPSDIFKANLNAHIQAYLHYHPKINHVTYDLGPVDWSQFKTYAKLHNYILASPHVLSNFSI